MKLRGYLRAVETLLKTIDQLVLQAKYANFSNWISEWLRGRVQRVCIQGVKSSWTEFLSGVPQGSVLGLILFLIYINDLDFGIRNWILKFADDTKIFTRINNSLDSEWLQSDLLQLIRWSEEWQMLFNVILGNMVRLEKYRDFF